jgi:hypothetical protein
MQPVRDWKEAGDDAVAGFARARDGGGSSSGYATAEVTNVWPLACPVADNGHSVASPM